MMKQQKKQNAARPPFHPAFGSRPQEIIGRDQIIDDFLAGLNEPVGSQRRCTFFKGQRGMGKTALLLELADRVADKDFVVAKGTAHEEMPEEIIEAIQLQGSSLFKNQKRQIQGFEAGAFGFSVGLAFTSATQKQFGFRTKLSLLCDKLAEVGKGVLILIDEACSSQAMRQVATTYQHLVGENKNIAIAMAGLPQAVSDVLNDDILTFLNHARKVELGPVGLASVRAYYTKAFRGLGIGCPDEIIAKAADETQGFPYLVQLVGYYLVEYASNGAVDDESLACALRDTRADLADNVFKPALAPLSDREIDFLKAMALDDGTSKVSDIRERLGVDNSYVQPYRKRLIERGVIESPRKGELTFTLAHLNDYLRE